MNKRTISEVLQEIEKAQAELQEKKKIHEDMVARANNFSADLGNAGIRCAKLFAELTALILPTIPNNAKNDLPEPYRPQHSQPDK